MVKRIRPTAINCLPENNRIEISALINYVNNTLLVKLNEQNERLEILTEKLTALEIPPKIQRFNLEISDSESDEEPTPKKKKKSKPTKDSSKTNSK